MSIEADDMRGQLLSIERLFTGIHASCRCPVDRLCKAYTWLRGTKKALLLRQGLWPQGGGWRRCWALQQRARYSLLLDGQTCLGSVELAFWGADWHLPIQLLALAESLRFLCYVVPLGVSESWPTAGVVPSAHELLAWIWIESTGDSYNI